MGPFRSGFIGSHFCVSHLMLRGHKCCGFKCSKALMKKGLSMSPAMLQNALGLRCLVLEGSGNLAAQPAEVCHGKRNPSLLVYPATPCSSLEFPTDTGVGLLMGVSSVLSEVLQGEERPG